MAMNANTAVELWTESQIEAAKRNERQTKTELAQYKAQAPNHPLIRTATAITTAAVATHADVMIGDGKGDGVKIGTVIGTALAGGVAWKAGYHSVAHGFLDAGLGAGCALVAINVRESGLKAALEKEAKRAATQNQQPAKS